MIRLAVLAAGAALAASAALAQAPTPPPCCQSAARETSREERGRRPFNRAEMDACVDARVGADAGRLEAYPRPAALLAGRGAGYPRHGRRPHRANGALARVAQGLSPPSGRPDFWRPWSGGRSGLTSTRSA